MNSLSAEFHTLWDISVHLSHNDPVVLLSSARFSDVIAWLKFCSHLLFPELKPTADEFSEWIHKCN